MGRDRILVVFDHKDRRGRVERGKVHCLIGGADLHGAIAEEGDRDGPFAAHLVSQRIAHRMGDIAADNGVGAEHACLGFAQMHRAATAAAIAGFETEDFGVGFEHNLLGGLREALIERIIFRDQRMVKRLGQKLMVHPVSAVDFVAGGQGRHQADGRAFLADAGMGRTVQQAFFAQFEQPFLEMADEKELFEHPRQFGHRHGAQVGFVRGQGPAGGVDRQRLELGGELICGQGRRRFGSHRRPLVETAR